MHDRKNGSQEGRDSMNGVTESAAEVIDRFRPSAPRLKKNWPDAFRREVFGKSLKTFLRLSETFAEDADADLIHDLRVEARRLGEQLRIVKSAAGAGKARDCREFLDRLVCRLSSVRNADVSRALAGRLGGEEAAAGEKEARALLDKVLGERRTRRLLKALNFWRRGKSRRRLKLLASLRRRRHWAGGGRKRRFDEAFSSHLERRREQSRLSLSGAALSSADEDLHLLRIALRRLRYSGEAAKILTGRPEAAELDRVRALQAALGDHHDLVVLSRRIAKAKEGLDAAHPAQARLIGGLDRLEALCAARLDARLQAFRRLLN